jgi:hypothetical protein
LKPTTQQLDVFIDLLVDAVLREMRETQESHTPEMQTPTPAFRRQRAGVRNTSTGHSNAQHSENRG